MQAHKLAFYLLTLETVCWWAAASLVQEQQPHTELKFQPKTSKNKLEITTIYKERPGESQYTVYKTRQLLENHAEVTAGYNGVKLLENQTKISTDYNGVKLLGSRTKLNTNYNDSRVSENQTEIRFPNTTAPGYDIINESAWPQWKKNLDFATTIILTSNTINLMLGMGCATYWREVVANMWPVTNVLIGMAGQFLLLPACGSFFSYVFRLTPYEAMGVLVVACSPGGSFSNFFTYWVDGDLALSIVMTTFSSTLAFIAMPLNIWLYSRIWIDQDEADAIAIPYTNILLALMFVTVPVAAGMAVRHYNAKVASIITKVASTVGWLGATSVMAIWGVLYWPVFASATPLLYVSSLLLPVVGISAAYGLAFLLRRTHKVCRTIGIETGSQNMAVALSIIVISFKDPAVKSSIIVFPTLYCWTLITEMFIGIGAYQAWSRWSQTSPDDYLPVVHTATVVKSAAAKQHQAKSVETPT